MSFSEMYDSQSMAIFIFYSFFLLVRTVYKRRQEEAESTGNTLKSYNLKPCFIPLLNVYEISSLERKQVHQMYFAERVTKDALLNSTSVQGQSFQSG